MDKLQQVISTHYSQQSKHFLKVSAHVSAGLGVGAGIVAGLLLSKGPLLAMILFGVMMGLFAFAAYCHYGVRGMEFDSIACSSEGLVRFNTQDITIIPYQEINGISNRFYFGDVTIEGKNTRIRIPKSKEWFGGFYSYLEHLLFTEWAKQIKEEGKMVFSASWGRKIWREALVIMSLMCPLLFIDNTVVIIATMIIVPYAYYRYLQKVQVITITQYAFHVKTLYKSHQFSFKDVTAIDYDKSGKVIFEFKQYDRQFELYEQNLGFPVATMYRFFQGCYGLKPIFDL